MDGPTKTETIFGGTELTVTCIDGGKRTVRVKQLALGQMPKLAESLLDEERLVDLFTGCGGLAAQLTPESAEAIVIEGERINMAFFGRWDARRKARAEMLPKQDPEEAAALIAAIAKSNPELAKGIFGLSLPTTLQTSADAAGSPSKKP